MTTTDLLATPSWEYLTVLDYRPLKSEPLRVRFTVGGDKLDYAYDAGSPTTDLLETNLYTFEYHFRCKTRC